MNLANVIIESQRLKLVPVSMKYRDQIFHYFNDEVTKYMYPAPAKEISETEAFIDSASKKLLDGIDYTFVILLKDTETFIGCGGIHHLEQESPEFGIWTKISSHGNHYGFEAIKASFDYFKDQYKSFIYPADKDNIASIKIAKGLGGVLNRTYDEVNQSGTLLHIEEYLIQSK